MSRRLMLTLVSVLFVLGLAVGGWQPALAGDADSCAKEDSCFSRCQCVQKTCRLGCFEKFKDSEGKVDPRKWEPCIDACVSSYKSCVQRC